MKKLPPVLIAFIFSLSINAQSPTLTFTNTTGSSSITCGTASINVLASVNNYTNASLTYTWISPSASLSGTNVNITSSGAYTITAFNTANSFSITQIYTIYYNTNSPGCTVNVPTYTLTCFTPSAILTGSSTNSNAVFNWAVSSSTMQVNTNTIVVNSVSPSSATVVANYTLTATDLANMCKSTQTVKIYQNIFIPVAGITPASSSFISCTTPSLFLTNGSSFNPSSPYPHTLPVTTVAWFGPVPQASLANSSSYTAYTPGTYTLIVQDQNNGCTSFATKTVGDSRFYPVIVASQAFNINCPAPTATIYPTLAGPTTGYTYSWTVPNSATVSANNTPTITVNIPGNYTVTVTNTSNSCSTTSLVPVVVCAEIGENLLSNDNIAIYPNPTNGLLTIDLKEVQSNFITVEVYSAHGKLIKKQAINLANSTINLQNEANGLYLIYIREGEKPVKMSKIVKN